MIDEIFDRGYQAGRADLHAGLDRGFARIGSIAREIGKSLKLLHRLEWSAPWTSRTRSARKPNRAKAA